MLNTPWDPEGAPTPAGGVRAPDPGFAARRDDLEAQLLGELGAGGAAAGERLGAEVDGDAADRRPEHEAAALAAGFEQQRGHPSW